MRSIRQLTPTLEMHIPHMQFGIKNLFVEAICSRRLDLMCRSRETRLKRVSLVWNVPAANCFDCQSQAFHGIKVIP
jgi:hypothetical protein